MRKKKGFSLIEVIISISIVVMLITGLFLSYKSSWDLINESADLAVARTAIISKLEELKQYHPSMIRTYNNTTFTTPLANGEIMTGRITISTTDPPLVSITMSWGLASSPKTVSASAIIYRPIYETEE